MKKQTTAIFDINKPFPKQFGGVAKILVKFPKQYSIYLHSTLEPFPYLLEETDFLGRFKRCMYDGRIAPLMEVREMLVPPDILACIDPNTRKVSFVDLVRGQEFYIEGKYLEWVNYRAIPDLNNWISQNKPYVINDERFAQEFIEYYKLDNLYKTKLMKIYNSSYFDGMNNSSDRIEAESLELYIPSQLE